jgi:hypothetical protein
LNTALNHWAAKWRRNNWKTSEGTSVKNREVIEYTVTLLELRRVSGQEVTIEHVKGHSGDRGNDGADALATAALLLPAVADENWVELTESAAARVGISVNVSPSSSLDRASGYLTGEAQDILLDDEQLARVVEDES